MENNIGLVSIIIPVYNGANYLKHAIDSALSQTYKNIEILVINDGSNDGGETERIALSYGDKIRYFSKENGGVSSALNLGIKNMKGEYFSWLSHDDAYTPAKIENQVKLLSKFEDNNICAICLCKQIDKNNNDLSGVIKIHNLNSYTTIDSKMMLKHLLTEQALNGCAILIPKKVLDDVPAFDENLRYNQDFKMWVNICLDGYKWIVSDELGVLSRVHDKQVTQTSRDLMFKDSYAYGKEIIPKLADISNLQNNFLFLYALNNAKYNVTSNVILSKKYMKKNNLISFKESLKIYCFLLYGKIRPFVRRVYYKLFKKVKTQ